MGRLNRAVERARQKYGLESVPGSAEKGTHDPMTEDLHVRETTTRPTPPQLRSDDHKTAAVVDAVIEGIKSRGTSELEGSNRPIEISPLPTDRPVAIQTPTTIEDKLDDTPTDPGIRRSTAATIETDAEIKRAEALMDWANDTVTAPTEAQLTELLDATFGIRESDGFAIGPNDYALGRRFTETEARDALFVLHYALEVVHQDETVRENMISSVPDRLREEVRKLIDDAAFRVAEVSHNERLIKLADATVRVLYEADGPRKIEETDPGPLKIIITPPDEQDLASLRGIFTEQIVDSNSVPRYALTPEDLHSGRNFTETEVEETVVAVFYARELINKDLPRESDQIPDGIKGAVKSLFHMEFIKAVKEAKEDQVLLNIALKTLYEGNGPRGIKQSTPAITVPVGTPQPAVASRGTVPSFTASVTVGRPVVVPALPQPVPTTSSPTPTTGSAVIAIPLATPRPAAPTAVMPAAPYVRPTPAVDPVASVVVKAAPVTAPVAPKSNKRRNLIAAGLLLATGGIAGYFALTNNKQTEQPPVQQATSAPIAPIVPPVIAPTPTPAPEPQVAVRTIPNAGVRPVVTPAPQIVHTVHTPRHVPAPVPHPAPAPRAPVVQHGEEIAITLPSSAAGQCTDSSQGQLGVLHRTLEHYVSSHSTALNLTNGHTFAFRYNVSSDGMAALQTTITPSDPALSTFNLRGAARSCVLTIRVRYTDPNDR